MAESAGTPPSSSYSNVSPPSPESFETQTVNESSPAPEESSTPPISPDNSSLSPPSPSPPPPSVSPPPANSNSQPPSSSPDSVPPPSSSPPPTSVLLGSGSTSQASPQPPPPESNPSPDESSPPPQSSPVPPAYSALSTSSISVNSLPPTGSLPGNSPPSLPTTAGTTTLTVSAGSSPSPPSDASPVQQNPTSLGDPPPYLVYVSQYQLPGTAPQASNSVPSPSTVNTPPKEPLPPPAAKAPAPQKANNKTNSNSHSAIAVSEVMGGIFIITFIAILFIVRRRRRKQPGVLPNNYLVQSGECYDGQKPTLGNSGTFNPIYSTQPQNPAIGNNYGSQRGQPYNGGGPDSGFISSSNSFFSYEEVMEMTNGFSRQNVIGQGGFGCVYKGWLPDGKMVAVKQLKVGSGQGEREFRAEVEIISRVHHRHLVSLVGYCIAENQRLLIYEFVPNNTVEHHLYGKGLPVLDWTKRVKVALGAAKGLAYLHEDCHPKIIHRDIKSANILLDDAFEAQVADFGLAKLTNDTHTHVSTRVMGTFGYMAPEYASSGKLTDRSDVFSFGVVLLELITGRKPVDTTQPVGDESLVEWARPLLIHALETGDFSELVDPRLGNHYVESELLKMIEAAAACVRHSAQKRPRMAKVMRALDNDDESSDLSNGVKYGESTAYESDLYNEDIMRLQRMALGSEDSSEFDIYSGEYDSRELPHTPSSWTSQGTSSRFPSGEF